MKKIIVIMCCVLCVENTFSQPILKERKGNFRSHGNIAGGYLFQQKRAAAYITGDGDIFIDNHVALTGSLWFSVPLGKKYETGIKANHQFFGGVNYHILKQGRWDPYFGLTPGVGLVSAAYQNGEELRRTKISPVPLVSAAVGCNYYIGSIFNFYLKLQGVTGQLLKDVPQAVPLHELKMTAGLGWNFKIPKMPNNKWM